MSLGYTVRNHLRCSVKGSNKVRGEKVNQHTYQFCNADRADDAKYGAFFARWYSFAPRFWLIKVVKAMAKQVMGESRIPQS